MKDKVAVGATGGVTGFLLGAMSPAEALDIAKWLADNLGPVGFVSFAGNIAQAIALYFTIQFFAKRDDQKRDDMKEAFTQINSWVNGMHSTIDKYRDALHRLEMAFVKEGRDV